MTVTSVPERDFDIEVSDSRRIAVAEWGKPEPTGSSPPRHARITALLPGRRCHTFCRYSPAQTQSPWLSRHRAGGKLAVGDALIAEVASEHGATVVTRNRWDFERQGIPVLDY